MNPHMLFGHSCATLISVDDMLPNYSACQQCLVFEAVPDLQTVALTPCPLTLSVMLEKLDS